MHYFLNFLHYFMNNFLKRSLVISHHSGFLHKKAWPQRNNKIGVKVELKHQSNESIFFEGVGVHVLHFEFVYKFLYENLRRLIFTIYRPLSVKLNTVYKPTVSKSWRLIVWHQKLFRWDTSPTLTVIAFFFGSTAISSTILPPGTLTFTLNVCQIWNMI